MEKPWKFVQKLILLPNYIQQRKYSKLDNFFDLNRWIQIFDFQLSHFPIFWKI